MFNFYCNQTPSIDWTTVIISIASAVIGALIAGYFTSEATKKAHIYNQKLKEDETKLYEKATALSIVEELKVLGSEYQEEFDKQYEELNTKPYLTTIYEISQDYSTVYTQNAREIGLIKNATLRNLIIKSNILLKKYIEDLKIYKQLLGKHYELNKALHDVVKSGKARYIGASVMWSWEFERLNQIAERNGWTKFVSMQNQYNLIYREEEREMMPLCQDRKIAVVPWSPLAGGRCAHPWGTKTARNSIDEVSPMVWGATDEQDKVVVDNLEKISKELGYSMAQVSLAWMLSKPYVTSPIVGCTDVKHVEEAVSALDIKLSDDIIKRLEAPYVPHIQTGLY